VRDITGSSAKREKKKGLSWGSRSRASKYDREDGKAGERNVGMELKKEEKKKRGPLPKDRDRIPIS